MKPDDNPLPLKGGVPITGDPLSASGVIGHSVAMGYLTWWLGQLLQQDGCPVIDKTGLEGYYDFQLSYTPELAGDASDRPDLFQALREQLGLRLDRQRGQVGYFVIDGVEKPDGN